MSKQEELENDYELALKHVQTDVMYIANARPLTEMDKRNAACSLFYLEGLCREAIRKMLATFTETEDKANV